MTTLPAPITAPTPIETPERMVAPAPIQTSDEITVLFVIASLNWEKFFPSRYFLHRIPVRSKRMTSDGTPRRYGSNLQ